MANWDKQYEAASAKGDIMRRLGFSAMKSNNLDDRDVIDNLEELVNAQIQLERENTKIQKTKSRTRGMWLGAAITWVGLIVGTVIKVKFNKK